MWARLRQLAAWFQRPAATTSLTDDDVGVAIGRSDRTEPILIRWDEVDEIEAFKVDFYSFDDVRLVLCAGELRYELSEEFPGFVDVMCRMQDRFPTIPKDWYMIVRETAFERNFRVLWSRRRTTTD
jgi:hypothetical protein